MDQPELGKNEEDMQQEPSSAELSPQDTTDTPPTDQEQTGTGAPEQPENAEAEAENPVSETAQVTAETDMETAAAQDDAQQDTADDTDVDDDDLSDDGDDDTAATQTEDNGLRRGMLVTGTIKHTSPTAIFIQLENDVEGLVPARELELMTSRTLSELSEGDEITVYVVNPRNHKGRTILSINQALEEQDWRTAEDYRKKKDVYDGRIGGYNKGGLIVRFGQLRGFVPQSQIADTRMAQMSGETPEERFGGMVNDEISVKVMEVDRQRNRLILSERAAMREVRQRRKEALIGELEVGEDRDGIVVSLENFGAFVDVGGAEGLVHITEVSHDHITHPKQALEVGQRVKVRVISIDERNNRIGLSIKALLPDPWDEIRAEYGEGVLVRATVTKLTKFGAFARLHGRIPVEGLIHISELAEERVEHPRDVVQRNDELTLRVVKVDVANRRLGLSLKQVKSAAYLDIDMERAFKEADAKKAAQPEAAEVEEVADDAATAVEDAVEQVQDTAETVAEQAVETAEDAVEQVQDTAETVAEQAVETAEDAVEQVQDTAETVAEQAVETAEDAVEQVQDVVENVTGQDDETGTETEASDDAASGDGKEPESENGVTVGSDDAESTEEERAEEK